jgi:hypothetical protein
MKIDIIGLKTSWQNWRSVQGILRGLHRQDELTRLVQWANRKQLAGVQTAYQYKLADEELRLNQYIVKFPHLATWARWLHFINKLVTPSPKFYPRGAAAKFRRQIKRY